MIAILCSWKDWNGYITLNLSFITFNLFKVFGVIYNKIIEMCIVVNIWFVTLSHMHKVRSTIKYQGDFQLQSDSEALFVPLSVHLSINY